jgi:hypothetical protein
MSALLTEHRGRLVAKYRVNPQVWPDGIDSPGDRWYKPEDWGPTDAKGIARPVNTPTAAAPVKQGDVKQGDVKQDRAAYMREYMRTYMRKARAEALHAPNADD